MVKDKDATNFKIIFNKAEMVEPRKKSPVKDIEKSISRRDEILSVHEKRFELFKWDPVQITNTPRVRNVIFKK